ncbi:DUF4270 family protein [Paraflavisolibacter sp. H34]|uniref:DUF4270 family protein n=1 Tax=Huijunlia imazamoxiresistens TaxID=3127457 RepID=UPI00301B1A36
MMKTKTPLLPALLLVLLLSSCYKKSIQFGNELGETYTRLAQIDTVAVELSTVLLDSFATTSPDHFLLGRYNDPYFGQIEAAPYLQLALPTDLSVSSDAAYDSLVFRFTLNGYYYGDTTKAPTLQVNELSEYMDYTYSSNFYNTSRFAAKPVPLGTAALPLYPGRDTLVTIRLNDAKGTELLNKLKNKEDETLDADAFLNYFRGLTLSLSGNDNGAVYGLKTSDSALAMRLYYHTRTPYPEQAYKDFVFSKTKYFNHITAERTGTLLKAPATGTTELPTTATGNRAFSQTTLGVLAKLTFPSLRNILQVSSTVKLLKATLVVRVADGTYDAGKLKLPQHYYLAATNGSNAIGSYVYDSTSSSVLFAQPVTDPIYNKLPYYAFDLTSAINSLLTTPGSAEDGFFLLENSPAEGAQVNRALLEASGNGASGTQLVLSVLTIKD